MANSENKFRGISQRCVSRTICHYEVNFGLLHPLSTSLDYRASGDHRDSCTIVSYSQELLSLHRGHQRPQAANLCWLLNSLLIPLEYLFLHVGQCRGVMQGKGQIIISQNNLLGVNFVNNCTQFRRHLWQLEINHRRQVGDIILGYTASTILHI